MTRADMLARAWPELDILLVTGDAYIDHPSFGVAVIGRVLEAAGWRVGIVAQPDWRDAAALTVMGRPRLFVGVTAGNLDSMVSNYSAARHKRKEDAYSPGGKPGLRPNHAATTYAQLCRKAFPGLPVVLGGIEASMRRIAHYDYWEDKLRPSILATSKADILVYGMGERAVREIARRLDQGEADLRGIAGTAILLGGKASAAHDVADAVLLPSWEALQNDSNELLGLTRITEAQQSPFCGKPLIQMHGNRALVIERPAMPLSADELDAVHGYPYQRRAHPSYCERVPGFASIENSVIVSRGCAGGCSFCGLGLHQGKFLTSRTVQSVLGEVRQLTALPQFRGTVSDLGGPTANLYGTRNGHTDACKRCHRVSCLWPSICPHFEIDEGQALALLRSVRNEPDVRHVFIQSGIRMDVALRTPEYLRELIQHHVSGHLKVAPEHLHPDVLRRMRKPAGEFEPFRQQFESLSREVGKKQYLVPYFISSFPGCSAREMARVGEYLKKERWNLQQVQDFIPLPMTAAAAMYVTGKDLQTGNDIPVVRHAGEREQQKRMLHPSQERKAPDWDRVD